MRQYSKTSTLIRNLIIVGDFVVLNILFYIYIHLDCVENILTGAITHKRLIVLANIAMLIAQYFFSTVVHQRHSDFARILRQVSLLAFLQFVAMCLLCEIDQGYEGFNAPGILFELCFLPVFWICLLLARFAEYKSVKAYRSIGHNQRHAVFVGTGPSMLAIYEYLIGDPAFGYSINGYFADQQIADCPEGLKYRGTLEEAQEIMKTHIPVGTVEELYCCLPFEQNDFVDKLMHFCDNNTIRFYYVPNYPIEAHRSLKLERIGSMMAFTAYDEPLQRVSNRIIKRTFDIVMSLAVLICLLPFLPFIAIAIKCSSRGPIFFRQERTGINGRNFHCYKFRSMHVNKDADKKQATKNDPRKFAFGNFMRKTNIDELPQFFNVLIGDMSVVGPRPHMLSHTEMYRDRIDAYMVRHFIKPGITGWAQVTGYRGETSELWQMEGRVQRDIWYIEHWSFWLDIVIIWKTIAQCIMPDKHAY